MIELKLNTVEPRIHLLNPYVAALAVQAINEGIARWVGTGKPESYEYVTPNHISTVLQLLVLEDRVSMFYSPEAVERARGYGITHLDVTGLRTLDILDFVDAPTNVSKRLFPARTAGELWAQIADSVRLYEDFITAQLAASGMPFHWSLLRLIDAVRAEDSLRIALLEQSIPVQDRDLAQWIIKWRASTVRMTRLEGMLASVVLQLEVAFTLALAGKARVAGAMATEERKPPEDDVGDRSSQVLRVVVDQLLSECIEFPVPQCFKDVIRLRAVPEVRAFREFVFPFIDAAVAGDADAFQRLRKEVRSAAVALRRLPGMRRAIAWVTYAAVATSVVEAFCGLVGPSIGMGLIPIGMERLANHWKRRSNWLYLAGPA